MSDNLNNNLDNFFKDELGDFTPPPPCNAWNKIDSELDQRSFDKLIKNELEAIQPRPAEKNWLAIQKNIPLHLKLRNHLSLLSKIAAAVVFITFISTYYHLQNSDKQQIAEGTLLENNFSTSTNSTTIEQVEYVFDLKETASTNKSASEELSDEVALKKAADEFLNVLLEDEDEFNVHIDIDEMKEILRPVQQLPIEDITAILTSPKQAKKQSDNIIDDIKITIPLKVVEDHEVEALLKQYDENHPQ